MRTPAQRHSGPWIRAAIIITFMTTLPAHVMHAVTIMRTSNTLIKDSITLWNLCGWFGAAAENTGALERPVEDELAGIIGYKYVP